MGTGGCWGARRGPETLGLVFALPPAGLGVSCHLLEGSAPMFILVFNWPMYLIMSSFQTEIVSLNPGLLFFKTMMFKASRELRDHSIHHFPKQSVKGYIPQDLNIFSTKKGGYCSEINKAWKRRIKETEEVPLLWGFFRAPNPRMCA